MATEQAPAAQWWDAFPAPRASCPSIEAGEVKQMLERLEQEPSAKRDFLLVDVRRTDWEGGTIKSSINFPAQTLYQTRQIIYDLCVQAGITKIIFYCGSSSGRGPRSANWMQDYINERGDEGRLQSLILKGGVKGWVKAYGASLMDFWEPTYWEQFK
ncbi:uncharacterized protein E0L32_000382 [Thyridium curvatum]|uniref:Rhodanese domain-containing protein n=1 Tax=Thyridium curvatum TaxID=1093900 RepID=A0A507BH43_9PEZI|nr:uncharacterized protein E0L32_000382 [Thyridium curvatum]TPX16048.1 hypothetical protein E0L32_000382 [Thyridium curvatum]